ncbi:MAG: Ubiquinone biosynthesis O-methyltransferase [Candidatus Dependentiae bacterium ADurb.Bin331]|nr:MAG: Ubiquinone biosynthesis O-methyltransferase [Candidatus Dependentiae bacterium ADurb.Bin331]
MNHMSSDQAIKENSKAAWGASPAGWVFGQEYECGTKEFFEAVLQKRFSYEVPWLNEMVQFKRFTGKSVLEIGCGVGYDAYQFCKAGAYYTGIDITPQNPPLARKHLSYYGLQAQFEERDVENISFLNEFDFVFTFGVLHHTPNIKKALGNCFNALKPGGEIQVIVYNKWSIFYCLTVVTWEWFFKGNFLKRSLADQRSLIETINGSSRPLVNVYSKRALKKLMNEVGFGILRTDTAKLTVEDLPQIPFIVRLYKYIPQSLLTALGRFFGWYISVRAIKPLTKEQ